MTGSDADYWKGSNDILSVVPSDWASRFFHILAVSIVGSHERHKTSYPLDHDLASSTL
jgi:hypothetical protein